ncbi:GrpB family protein [Haloarchaeobius sp. DFWS5]|uniref:GrpB family protein n=1 Tax=Haloarchaeobius sp. DFWS5 TaxID=3446114 RepID=UPI003EB8346A
MSDPDGERTSHDPDDESLGLARNSVELVSHDESWHHAYEREADRLRAELGDELLDIEHVGSTAVCGLPAKPILDITIAVRSLPVARELRPRIESLGYEFRPDDHVPDRLFFARGPESRRTHYLSLTPARSPTWREQVTFRDRLRGDIALRDEYADLKRRLADAFSENRSGYTAAKNQFIERVLSGDGDDESA